MLQLDLTTRTSQSAPLPTYEDAIELRDQIGDIDEVAVRLESVPADVLLKMEILPLTKIMVTMPAWGRLQHKMRQFIFPTRETVHPGQHRRSLD
jgi:hypothetical protein